MAVSTTTNRISYAGNGVTTAFSYPYKFLKDADLKVYLRVNSTGVETLKTLTTNYTVAGAGNDNGGTVTMLVAPTSGETLVILNDPTPTQETDLVENDALPAETLEDTLDKLTLLIQRLRDLTTRTVKLSEGFSPSFDLTLPTNLDQAANKAVSINSAGNGFAPVADWPSVTEISNASTNAASAAASASAAAASAATAASNATSVLDNIPFKDVVFRTFGDGALSVVAADIGKVFSFDLTWGPVTATLPEINALSSTQRAITFLKTDSSSNKLTIQRAGTDTINGQTSITVETEGAGVILIADEDGTPDSWTVIEFGASVGGGGAGLEWYFGESNAPIEAVLSNGLRVLDFSTTDEQEMFCQLAVPTSFVAGTQIKLIDGKVFAAATTGNVLFKAETVIMKAAIDATSSPTAHVSTNTQVAVAGTANQIVAIGDIDLTDSSGEINSVAVAPGDVLLVKLFRDTSAETSGLNGDARLLRGSFQPKFTA